MNRIEIILACSLMTGTIVATDKSHILSDDATEDPWITSEKAYTMIEASFNTSKCVNVYLAGGGPRIESLFDQFLQVYPYEYTINERTYACSGYLAITDSTEKLKGAIKWVPAKISNTELLIIIDDEIDEKAGIFNVSLYENANVNIVGRNGLWSLSENYLSPRKFKKVFKYEELVHKRGIVDLQGRELQAAAFFYPPLCYLNSTVNRTVNGIYGEFFTLADESELDGIETKLFLLMAERLNFTWTIRKPNNNYRYGRRNGSSWYGGMIGQMFRNEIDIAFTGIWLQLDHYSFSNLSNPWTNLDIRFSVPRPKPYTSFWALTRPLSPWVWTAVVAMVLAQSLQVYTKARMNPKIPARFRSFTTTWTELMARLTGTCSDISLRGLEMQFQLWHMIGVLVVTAYSSSLAASLASSGFEKRIDSAHQFIAANLTWGREGPVPKFNDFFGEGPMATEFASRFHHEESEFERHEKIVKGNYAIIGRIIGSVFFPENYVRDDDMKGYRVMRDSMGNFYSSFAVQPWLLNSVDQLMLHMQEAGLIRYHLTDVLHRRTSSSLYGMLVERDGPAEGAHVLELTPLGAGISMFAAGLLISTVVFFYELKSVDKTKTILQVLRDIQRKRKLFESKKSIFDNKKNANSNRFVVRSWAVEYIQ